MAKQTDSKAQPLEPLKLEMTVRVKKGCLSTAPKRRAPRAVRNLREQARKLMGVSDVRISPELTNFIWRKGIEKVPHRVRVRFNRKRNEAMDAKEEFYALVELVECANFKGLLTETVTDDK